MRSVDNSLNTTETLALLTHVFVSAIRIAFNVILFCDIACVFCFKEWCKYRKSLQRNNFEKPNSVPFYNYGKSRHIGLWYIMEMNFNSRDFFEEKNKFSAMLKVCKQSKRLYSRCTLRLIMTKQAFNLLLLHCKMMNRINGVNNLSGIAGINFFQRASSKRSTRSVNEVMKGVWQVKNHAKSNAADVFIWRHAALNYTCTNYTIVTKKRQP